MALINNPGCFQCGKVRHTSTQLCESCNSKRISNEGPKPKAESQLEGKVLPRMVGQVNTIDCNKCRTNKSCNGRGIIPNGSCKDYTTDN